ncbi:MAG: hypothetical protein H6865_07700 [Rhodospirillales bacterium]|nr:hypothetical protein [Rhodospirillales bacterium]USO07527.1 MAG: hypothetical protein H6866_08955 [Rhodospirillales bacterium]
MDLTVYVSQLQNRTFLALAGLALALLFDMGRGLAFGHRADPRPLMEKLADMLLYPMAARLNRAGRPDGALTLRGVMVLALGCMAFFGGVAALLHFAHRYGQGGAALTLLVALSTGTVGWFAPLRALSRILSDSRAPRPYMVLARATYTNMISLDESGIIRVACTAAIRSLAIRLAAPLVLFILFGWQVLALYWPVMALALATGQDGTSRAFAAVTNALATLLLLVPTLLIFPVVLVALFFSAGSSFFRALPGFFRVTRWPRLLQGGLPLLVAAYAMRLALGGPRQDRAGAGIMAPWVGPDRGTARLESRDIGRVLYLQAVTLLLTGTILFLLAVV